MAIIFDGKKFASEKLDEMRKEAEELKKRRVVPKLISILVGDDYASKLYVSLKKKAGERIGVKVDILKFKKNVGLTQLINLIKRLNKDKSVHGIMIQLPLPRHFTKSDRDRVINAISYEKDVDGLAENSLFLTPVVAAVLMVVKKGTGLIAQPVSRVIVIGAFGFEGQKIAGGLKEMGYRVEAIDIKTKNLKLKTKNADILISVTGVEGLIRKDMVKSGAVVIDVGSPQGDVKTQEVVEKVAFISPVPGGIGPVTIYYLLDNLIKAASREKN